jgi:hypothetical protein
VARSAIASLYSITDDEEHLCDYHTYMLCAVNRSLPVDVR